MANMKTIFTFLFGLIFLCLSSGVYAQQYESRFKDAEQKLLDVTREFDSVILVNESQGLVGSDLLGYGMKNGSVYKIHIELKFHLKKIYKTAERPSDGWDWILEKVSFVSISESKVENDTTKKLIAGLNFSSLENINQNSLSISGTFHCSNQAITFSDLPFYILVLLKSGKYYERGSYPYPGKSCEVKDQQDFDNLVGKIFSIYHLE